MIRKFMYTISRLYIYIKCQVTITYLTLSYLVNVLFCWIVFLVIRTLTLIQKTFVKFINVFLSLFSIFEGSKYVYFQRSKLILYFWKKSFKKWLDFYKAFLKFGNIESGVPKNKFRSFLVRIRGINLEFKSLFKFNFYPYSRIKSLINLVFNTTNNFSYNLLHYKIFRNIKNNNNLNSNLNKSNLSDNLILYSNRAYLHLDKSRLIKSLYNCVKLKKSSSFSNKLVDTQFVNSKFVSQLSDINPFYVKDYFPYTYNISSIHFYRDHHLRNLDDVAPLGPDFLEFDSYNDVTAPDGRVIYPYASTFWGMQRAFDFKLFNRWLRDVGIFGTKFRATKNLAEFKMYYNMGNIEKNKQEFFDRDPIIFLNDTKEYSTMAQELDRPFNTFDSVNKLSILDDTEVRSSVQFDLHWPLKDYFNALKKNWYRLPKKIDFVYATRDMFGITLTFLLILLIVFLISNEFIFVSKFHHFMVYNFDDYRSNTYYFNNKYRTKLFGVYHHYWPFIYERRPYFFESPFEFFMFERSFKGFYHVFTNFFIGLFLPFSIGAWLAKHTNALPHFTYEYYVPFRNTKSSYMLLEQQYLSYKSIDPNCILEDINALTFFDYYFPKNLNYIKDFIINIIINNELLINMWLCLIILGCVYLVCYLALFFLNSSSFSLISIYLLLNNTLTLKLSEGKYLRSLNIGHTITNKYFKYIFSILSNKSVNHLMLFDNSIISKELSVYQEYWLQPVSNELSSFKVHLPMYFREFFFLPEFRTLGSYNNWLNWYDEINYIDNNDFGSYLAAEGDGEYYFHNEETGSTYELSLLTSKDTNIVYFSSSPLYSIYNNRLREKYFDSLVVNDFSHFSIDYFKTLQAKILKYNSSQWLYDNYELFYPNNKLSSYSVVSNSTWNEEDVLLTSFTDNYDVNRFAYSIPLLKLHFYRMYYLYNFHKKLRHFEQRSINGKCMSIRGMGYIEGSHYRFYNPIKKMISEFNFMFMQQFFMSDEKIYLSNTLTYTCIFDDNMYQNYMMNGELQYHAWLESGTSISIGEEYNFDYTYMMDNPIFEISKKEVFSEIYGKPSINYLFYTSKLAEIDKIYWSKDNVITWLPQIRGGEHDTLDYYMFSEFVPIFTYLFNQFEEWRYGGYYSGEELVVEGDALDVWAKEKSILFPLYPLVLHSKFQTKSIGAWPYGLDLTFSGSYAQVERRLVKQYSKVGGGNDINSIDFSETEAMSISYIRFEESIHYTIEARMRRFMRLYDDFDIRIHQLNDLEMSDFALVNQWLSDDLIWYTTGSDVYSGYESWL